MLVHSIKNGAKQFFPSLFSKNEEFWAQNHENYRRKMAPFFILVHNGAF